MPHCNNCGTFVSRVRPRVRTARIDTVRVCPNCEEKLRDGAGVREAQSPRHVNNA
ncbi:DUF7563 family protein [Halococcus morrhuae DSM 1307]|uniref:DUF7563 family protein n=1 Tax=Halococcus TaxID=2249 RepID=UPI003CC7F91B